MKYARKDRKLWSTGLDLRGNLTNRLPKLARKYFRRGRKALASGASWDDVHQFRLATKRFRYTLELFRSEYGPGLEKRLDPLRHIQTMLGDANDCITTSAMLEPISGTGATRAKLAKKAESKLRKLRSWWRANLAAEDSQEQWIAYMRRFPRRTGNSKVEPPVKQSAKAVQKS